jgi:hypothetical protein
MTRHASCGYDNRISDAVDFDCGDPCWGHDMAGSAHIRRFHVAERCSGLTISWGTQAVVTGEARCWALWNTRIRVIKCCRLECHGCVAGRALIARREVGARFMRGSPRACVTGFAVVGTESSVVWFAG